MERDEQRAHDPLTCPCCHAVGKRPFCCPVCHGAGTVSRPPHIAGDVIYWSSSDLEPYSCRACDGTGIVWGLK